MKRKWKILFASLLVLMVVGYLVYENQKGLEVPALAVEPGAIATAFKEEGTIVSTREQQLYALYPGEVLAIHVEEGDAVKAGDLLVVVNTSEINYQLQQVQAQIKSTRGEQSGTFQAPYESQVSSQKLLVEQAETDLAIHQANLDRLEVLYEEGAVPEKDFEAAAHMVSSAERSLLLQEKALSLLYETSKPGSGTAQFYAGRIEALQAQANLLDYQRQRAQIKAPFDGVVGHITVKEGDLAGGQYPLLHLFDPKAYELEVFLLTSDVSSVHPGMVVNLILETREQDITFPGTVKKIAPTATVQMSALGLEEQRVRVTIGWNSSEGVNVFPGYRVDAEFTTDRREDVLIVPKTAVFSLEEGHGLWVVRDGRAQVQAVQTGFETNLYTVITEGIEKGDLVITNAQFEGLREGRRVRVN